MGIGLASTVIAVRIEAVLATGNITATSDVIGLPTDWRVPDCTTQDTCSPGNNALACG